MSRQKNRKLRGLSRALGQIYGYGTYGIGTKATLYIGRKAGLNLSGFREGQTVPIGTVERTILGYRAAQVGGAAGATLLDARGVYKGGKEPTIVAEITWIPSAGEKTPKAFEKNVKKLAQEVARELAQREVIVEWTAPGKKRGRIDTATPTGAPSATQEAAFCAWVRRNSGAGRRPSDPCHRPSTKKKK